MTRSPNKRPSTPIDHRSTKRRKGNLELPTQYSRRSEVPWSEQRQLGGLFKEVGPGAWPASRILEERGKGQKKEYLLEWEIHPSTGEHFQPTWVISRDVGASLKAEWLRRYREQSAPALTESKTLSNKGRVHSAVSRDRRQRNRKVVPDSSPGETDELLETTQSADSSPPTLITSRASSISGIEILESQEVPVRQHISVNVPPPPTDKSEYESLRASQYSSQTAALGSSPTSVSGIIVDASQSQDHSSHKLLLNTQPEEQNGSWQDHLDAFSAHTPLGASLRGLRPDSISRTPERVANSQYDTPGRFASQPPSVSKVGPQSSRGRFVSTIQHNTAENISVKGDKPDKQTRRRSDSKGQLKNTSFDTLETSSIEGEQQVLIQSSSRQESEPWQFYTQIPIPSTQAQISLSEQQAVRAKSAARKRLSRLASPFEERRPIISAGWTPSVVGEGDRLLRGRMASSGTRQSPRLQSSNPDVSRPSPRMSMRSSSRRTTGGSKSMEPSSPLTNVIPEITETMSPVMNNGLFDGSIEDVNLQAVKSSFDALSSGQQHSINPSALQYSQVSDENIGSTINNYTNYDTTLEPHALGIQESIEDELQSSPEDNSSLESKASSSQQSLNNERLVPQVDGVMMPTHPTLGPDEYVLTLPAEGKVQSIYSETIKVKRKAIMKFIKHRGSIGTSTGSPKKTHAQNEMLELVQRLHDITTHIDLGLPGMSTQYELGSQEHAKYAEYAGSKFVFLGSLVQTLSEKNVPIVVMAQPGALQDLIAEYLTFLHIQVRRYDHSRDTSVKTTGLKIDLLSTKSSHVVDLPERPIMVLAFDASFENSDAQMKRIQMQWSGSIPIIYPVAANSSEHVDRCLPTSLPSPTRLRVLVRATYQAHPNLGGTPTIIRHSSDEPEGRPMDLADLSRAARKGADRKVSMFANIVANAILSDNFAQNWTIGSTELQLEDLEETTPKTSRGESNSPLHGTRNTQPLLSRSSTPSGKKRFLDNGTLSPTKRVRLTPLDELISATGSNSKSAAPELSELREALAQVQAELFKEQQLRRDAEEARDEAKGQAAEWRSSLASLQHRYEKRQVKTRVLEKAKENLLATIEHNKTRQERTATDNATLKAQIVQLKSELVTARAELVSGGGDIAMLELAREEARVATAKAASMEKSLQNIQRDFEFTRMQYQDASNKAAELAAQLTALESENKKLEGQASEEKRRLKVLNYQASINYHIDRARQLEDENRGREAMLKKLEEENKVLKRSRGVQTRGSSAQPGGSPGPRSRQGSPATGFLAPHSGNRASVLRHER